MCLHLPYQDNAAYNKKSEKTPEYCNALNISPLMTVTMINLSLTDHDATTRVGSDPTPRTGHCFRRDTDSSWWREMNLQALCSAVRSKVL